MEHLDSVEVRVLGALLEKEATTPEYYPLSMNALVNACNQKSNRDPAVSYDEDTVADALDGLRAKGLARVTSGAEHRVPKYLQTLTEALNLGRRETAVLCVLMLRGPQTVGELRERTQRMHTFDDTEAVEGTLQRLIERDPEPFVTRMPRQTGFKEPRFAHLLSGPVEVMAEGPAPAAGPPNRVAQLEAALEKLRSEVADLQKQFAEFKKQFE